MFILLSLYHFGGGEGLKRKKFHFSSFSSKLSEERKIAGRRAGIAEAQGERGVSQWKDWTKQNKKKKKEGLLHLFYPANLVKT